MGSGMWFVIVTGFSLGLAYAAIPGPVNTETIRRGLASGFRPAVLVQLGAMLGDLVWAVVGLTGVAVLAGSDGVSTVLGFIGAVFLLGLALSSIQAARLGASPVLTTIGRSSRHVVIGAMFSLASPIGLVFWAGLGSGLIVALGDPTRSELVLVMLSFMTAVLVWSVGLSLAISLGRRHMTSRLVRFVDATSGVVLGWFGFHLLWSTVTRSVAFLDPITRILD